MTPKPGRDAGERGPTATSGASNIAGSSSPGARFASTKARGNARADERRAQLGDAVEQLVDKGVLGTAEADGIEARALGEA